LTIVNKSGYEAYLQLTSCDGSVNLYLTLPTGDDADPSVQVFNLQAGAYKRTTWQCQNQRTNGLLRLDGNIKLTMTACENSPQDTQAGAQ